MIQDEFSSLPLSRQRKYQLRKERDSKCTICGMPSFRATTRCRKHLMAARVHNREVAGCGEWQPGAAGTKPVEKESPKSRQIQLRRVQRILNTTPELILT